ncbi:MAG: VacJ family lipoprotein, partial [Alphaproteobacteria bacterium]|nr:VacJ family lipoprotein [Alphaproteobacteria bacterium]
MKILRFLCVCCLSFLCACQSIPTDAVQTENTQIQSENNDPFERYNRVMTDFNFNINRYVYQPIAKVYRKTLPSPVRTGIDNVATNLQQPVVFVN